MSPDIAIGHACTPNISTAERRKRLGFGVVAFLIALSVLAILVISGASPGWRLALYPLFVGAISGFFQWRDRT